MPDRVKDGQAEAAEAFAAADAPIVLGGGSEAFGAGLDLGAALLIEPVEAVELGRVRG